MKEGDQRLAVSIYAVRQVAVRQKDGTLVWSNVHVVNREVAAPLPLPSGDESIGQNELADAVERIRRRRK